MAELLIHAVGRGSDFAPGDIIDVQPDGWTWGASEGLPSFVIVKVPGVSVDQARAYGTDWRQVLDWTVVTATPATDTYRVDLVATAARASDGTGNLTKAQVEAFLTRWGVVPVAWASNGVRADFAIYAMATSQGYWDRNLTGFTFTERAYDSASFTHTIRLAYGTTNDATVAGIVAERATVVNQNTGQNWIDFTVTRQAVLDAFKASLRAKIEQRIARRRWHYRQTALDAAIAAGGVVTRTQAEALADLLDRVSE